jgi:hypothetical protein
MFGRVETAEKREESRGRPCDVEIRGHPCESTIAPSTAPGLTKTAQPQTAWHAVRSATIR